VSKRSARRGAIRLFDLEAPRGQARGVQEEVRVQIGDDAIQIRLRQDLSTGKARVFHLHVDSLSLAVQEEGDEKHR